MNPPVLAAPDAPLRASVLTSKLIALAAVVALAGAARAALPLGDAYALKAAVLFAAITGLSIGFLQQHHPFERFGPANQITTLRAMLVALVAALVGEPRVPAIATAAVGASLAVTLLDGVDGWLARRHEIASRFGARFDMEIDALLILALSVLAWRHGKAGAWVIASGADALPVRRRRRAGAVAARLARAEPPPPDRSACCRSPRSRIVMLPAIEPPLSAWLAGSRARGAHLLLPRRHPLAVASQSLTRRLTLAAAVAVARRLAVVPERLADAVDPLDRRVLGRVRRLPDPDHRRPAVARCAVARRAAVAHRRLAAPRARPLRRRHDAGALRPRHQPVLGRPLHAGRREDDRDRGAALADRRAASPRSRWSSRCSTSCSAGRSGASPRAPSIRTSAPGSSWPAWWSSASSPRSSSGHTSATSRSSRRRCVETYARQATAGRRRAERLEDAAAQPADDRGSRAGPRRRRLPRLHGIVRRDCLRAPRHGAGARRPAAPISTPRFTPPAATSSRPLSSRRRSAARRGSRTSA